MSYTEQLQKIANDYMASGQPWPATKLDIARWAMNNNRWQAQPAMLLKMCADEIAGAMGEEFITDPRGRRVRAKHVAKTTGPDGEQGYFWADYRTMSVDHMRISAQTERQQIANWCYRLKVDVDSFNEYRNPGPAIQISLNFEPDMADMEALEELEVAS